MHHPEEYLVSVLMPTRNEARYIALSLGAVLAQDYPADQLEIFVADGRSTDGTREIVRDIQDRHPNVSLIDNPGQIVATGLNTALRLARGEIVIRVDGHCEIAPDYVRRCVEHIKRDAVAGVGGSVETVGESYTAKAIALAMSSRFGAGDSAFRVAHGVTRWVDTIPFPAYTRAIVERAGQFDEELVRNQDDEYNYRLRQMGARLLLAADVRSRYYSRASLGGLWRQYFAYGLWKVRVLQKHPRQMSLRQFIPPAFVLTLGLGATLAPILPLARLALAYTIATYLLASLAASLLVARRGGWRYLPLLPPIFAIMHTSYGLGFLGGLIKFWNRWGDTIIRAAPFAHKGRS